MPIIVKQGDLTSINCDAVVNPANSFGYMGGGVAGALKRVGGIEIEKEAVKSAPIKVGSAVVTTAGMLTCKYVIHAPTMKNPAMRIGVENVKQATFAALKLAEKLTISSIAIPGMGTGVGGVNPKNAAKEIVKITKKFESSFETIILIDRNRDMVKYFKEFL